MNGVFWVIEGKLHSFPFRGEYPDGIAKSGNTYNHKKLWQYVKPKQCNNKSYNYYPRGRVDISNKGEIIIYLNPVIDDSFILQIKSDFGLTGDIKLRYDCSEHYKCYLDDDWKAD
jgi:hypothetical protein